MRCIDCIVNSTSDEYSLLFQNILRSQLFRTIQTPHSYDRDRDSTGSGGDTNNERKESISTEETSNNESISSSSHYQESLPQWTQFDRTQYSDKIAAINTNTFFGIKWGKGIAAYNDTTNSWTDVISFEESKPIWDNDFAFDIKTNKLYSTGEIYSMVVFNLTTNNIKYYKQNDFDANQSIYIPRLLHIKDKIHFIGGISDTKHYIWNDDLNKYEAIHNLCKQFCQPASIYIPRENKVLLIGYPGDGLCKYIWKYDIDTLQLENLGIPFELDNAAAIMTINQDYIILAGGYDEYGWLSNGGDTLVDMIHILDIRDPDDYKLYRSSIKLPFKEHVSMARTGGGKKAEPLVIGWIKRYYGKYLPNDIIKLIIKGYTSETIHCIEWGEQNEHYAINVSDVLSNVK